MPAQRTRRRTKLRRRAAGPDLDQLSQDELLDLRMCDLGVRIAGTWLERQIEKLYHELERRGIRFRPHFWLSDEWFTPDGVIGTAIPFYLSHPSLMRLERKQMLDVEGGTREWCLRILRHETGHALDNAYQLRRRRRWRDLFGKASLPYPEFYNPKPYSKRYVLHLDMWYAQSHPTEDFAETFAVWLKPRSAWRARYRDWPALKKLEYVDEVVREIRQQRPRVASRERIGSLRTMRKTLREHYRARRAHYGMDNPPLFHDRDLVRVFSGKLDRENTPTAASVLNRARRELRRVVAQWTGEYQYTIDQVLDEMIERCRELRLRCDRPEPEAKRDALVMLTVQTMNYLHAGHHRAAL
ncbi:MAG: putative zinc-binding metallopeptidase [Pirellulales bacterium]|nr:putative zinc-binding metallopeptidase [Pirellulales bacterium]